MASSIFGVPDPVRKIWWGGERGLNRPPTHRPTVNRSMGDCGAGHFDGLHQAHLGALVRHPDLTGGIVVLLLLGRPSTICRGIFPVIINSINRMFVSGLGAHVGKKCFEAVSPALTYSNPSPRVVLISWVFGIKAAILHVLPTHVLRRSRHSVRGAVLAIESAVASARFSASISEREAMRDRLVSAGAHAMPSGISIAVALGATCDG